MLEYAQESDQAERDGLNSAAIVMRERMKRKRIKNKNEKTNRRQKMVEEFLTKTCQRVIMNQYMNKRSNRTKCEMGEE